VSSYLLIKLKTENKSEEMKSLQKKANAMESNKPTEAEIEAFKVECMARINEHPGWRAIHRRPKGGMR
jgi:hypothetical protein